MNFGRLFTLFCYTPPSNIMDVIDWLKSKVKGKNAQEHNEVLSLFKAAFPPAVAVGCATIACANNPLNWDLKGLPQALTASDSALESVSDDSSTGDAYGLWARAFELAEKQEEVLMKDYQAHLRSLTGVSKSGVSFVRPPLVEEAVKVLAEEREKKQWRVQVGGCDVKIREQVDRLRRFIAWSDQIVSPALYTQPFAQLAWSSVTILLPLLKNATGQHEVMLGGFNTTCSIQAYWKLCEDVYLSRESIQNYTEFSENLAKLYSCIVLYQARVICHLSRAQLSRCWKHVTGQSVWEKSKMELESLNVTCRGFIDPIRERVVSDRWDKALKTMRESQAYLSKLTSITEEGHKQMQRNYEQQNEKLLLQDLAAAFTDRSLDKQWSPDKGSGLKSYKNINPKRVPGTCEWFFHDRRFCTWRDSDSSRLLWVSAGPGCGKSVLSRALIDEKRLSTDPTATICHFFFKDGDGRRMYATNALCALLHQIFTQDQSGRLIDTAVAKHEKQGSAVVNDFYELWDILETCVESPYAGNIICLIDALDECSKTSRKLLIEKLRDYYKAVDGTKSSSKLKFIITSRPYSRIHESFSTFGDTAGFVHFDGDGKFRNISEEVNLVIDYKMNDIANRLSAQDCKDITAKLKSIENRTYLWLKIIFDTIEDDPAEYNRRCDVDELLSSIPNDVFDAYDSILSQTLNKRRAQKLLQLLLAAKRPLRLDEASVALTVQDGSLPKMWEPGQFESVVKDLCGFISIQDDKLSFIHQTAREFLIHKDKRGGWQGHFGLKESHRIMFQACSDYLLLPEIDTPRKRIDPFLSYAGVYWPLHYKSQEASLVYSNRETAARLCQSLRVAAEKGHEEVVRILLDHGADIHTMNGRHAQIMAARGGHVGVLRLLLESGADVNARDPSGKTASHIASLRGYEKVLRLLINNGADLFAEDHGGRTSLYLASSRGHKEIARMLVSNGADVNATNHEGQTALHCASKEGLEEIVRLLIDSGADVNAKAGLKTALCLASSSGHAEVVRMLVSNGADVNADDASAKTALHCASEEGHEEIVGILIRNGADVNANYFGMTPLEFATGHKGVATILKEAGGIIL
ncbi:ankyrin repeat-containing protein [Grosmannia clavigera kw1407]|uniref:Ankyrin repeat-containing protein n=1 Tax=Grosmannia clavigera (strain kw1407 / UAMH 11150) TaxID=655863 RepID=F0X6L4_GROCL|nr:ankyrin repeat-containing protein [Grosmannia clavigera kw1407]EFX06671.1 ankyrin repeat-containing protein [Grosmannia clavigera kw1407]